MSPSTAVAPAAAALYPLHHSLPEMLSNLTLGRLIGDLGLMQFVNATSATNTVSNFSDQLTEHLLGPNDEVVVANLTAHELDEVAAAAAAASNQRDSLMVLLPVTVCYLLIFLAGLLGNVITCTVISRNKNMHTATNYYLFNLAISDLMLLLCGEYVAFMFVHITANAQPCAKYTFHLPNVSANMITFLLNNFLSVCARTLEMVHYVLHT